MRKVRDLSTIDYGQYTPKYIGQAGSGPNLVNTSTCTEEWIKSQLLWIQSSGASLAKKLLSVYAMSGREVFESTEHHKPTFNSCFHTRERSVNFMFSAWWLAYSSLRPSWQQAWRFKPPTGYQLATNIDWSAISSNIQAEAYHTMVPRFEGDVSMINFIFEMKDFRDIADVIAAKSYKWMNELNWTSKPGDALSLGTKLLASAHLTNSFVVNPTVNDLVEIIGQAQRMVMDVQEEFRKKGLQPDVRHFSKTLDQSQSIVQQSGLGSYEHFWLGSGTKNSTTFTATMLGDYGYRCRTGLDAFTKYWGLGLTAEAVWNAQPFSFLADYIFSIGHSLNVMRHDKNVSYHVRQYCESLLSRMDSGSFVRAGNRDHYLRSFIIDNTPHHVGNDRSKYLFVAGTSSSRYHRRVRAPYWGPFLPRIKVPSSKQGMNMLALVRCLL